MMTWAFPSPLEHPPRGLHPVGKSVGGLSCDPNGPLVAEVVKTSSDPYVGRISLMRVFSGTVRPDSALHVSGHFSAFSERPAGMRTTTRTKGRGPVVATRQAPATRTICVAGDICAIAKLTRAETGDTLGEGTAAAHGALVDARPAPPDCIMAHAKADEDKLAVGLTRLAAEDPTLRIEHSAETHQLVLWCMGEAHADVVLDRLANRYGVQVDQAPLRVPLREASAGRASGRGRHVKQSGGHGQYAVCEIEVEPLRRARGSSSSTRSSAVRSRGSSSRAWRRGSAPRWNAGSPRAIPSSTSG